MTVLMYKTTKDCFKHIPAFTEKTKKAYILLTSDMIAISIDVQHDILEGLIKSRFKTFSKHQISM